MAEPQDPKKQPPEEVRPCAARGDEFRVGQGTSPKGDDYRRDGRRRLDGKGNPIGVQE